MKTGQVVFKTVHGSHLYGLNHANSDYDTYVVKWGNIKGRQSTDGVDDVTTIGFGDFVHRAASGSPQALEAMFSTAAEIDEIGAFRSSFRAGGPEVRNTYMRTIKAFWLSEENKRQTHAWRLALNLESMQRCGRFNPRVGPVEVEYIRSMVKNNHSPLNKWRS